jgi:tRNA (cytidine/uridine-2'-O-)-methyltransferase
MKHAHSRKAEFDFRWPAVPLNVVLVQPEIPPNTGNVARLCAATGTRLHLVEPLGFQITNAQLRRAGLDYWDAVQVQVHPSWTACRAALGDARLFLYSTGSSRRHDQSNTAPATRWSSAAKPRAARRAAGRPRRFRLRHPHPDAARALAQLSSAGVAVASTKPSAKSTPAPEPGDPTITYYNKL